MATHLDREARAREIAESFTSARRSRRALAEFPGHLPNSLTDAYRCQDVAITLWTDEIVGWKVGMIHGENAVRFRTDRLVGPVFKSQVLESHPDRQTSAPIFVGGFAATEAEFIFKLASDAPENKVDWSEEEALSIVASLHAGIEIASSPLATINDLGPLAIISDFGNNNGMIVGRSIDNWRMRIQSPASLECRTDIDAVTVGNGSAQSIREGLVASLRFALSMGASRGMPLRSGHYICTGAVTGVHSIKVGEQAKIVFKDIDTLEWRPIQA